MMQWIDTLEVPIPLRTFNEAMDDFDMEWFVVLSIWFAGFVSRPMDWQ